MTTAGRIFQPAMAKHPGQSGFAIMPSGATAFRARNAMIRIAEKTLDAQYFSWESDRAGRVLFHQLLAAADRGVRVRVLTNSMVTNDVAEAFVGYRRYRKGLLEHGVELYEMRLKAGTQRKFWSHLASDSTAALHSKVTVFDRKRVFIGSFNLDHRSIEINTEIGLLIDSPELAKHVIEFMDTGIDPSNSYRLVLEKSGARDRGKITWVSRENAKEVRAGSDPDAGFRRPVSAWFISLFHSLLPIEDHL